MTQDDLRSIKIKMGPIKELLNLINQSKGHFSSMSDIPGAKEIADFGEFGEQCLLNVEGTSEKHFSYFPSGNSIQLINPANHNIFSNTSGNFCAELITCTLDNHTDEHNKNAVIHKDPNLLTTTDDDTTISAYAKKK